MIGRSWIMPITIAFLITSCDIFSPQIPQKDDAAPPGMKKIMTAGSSFHQGWDDSLAAQDERPGMLTSFTYDYWIDSVEVTQGGFAALMGRHPVADTSHCGVGYDYPVADVTWFDAVLFCNARSKAEGFDTVYIYSGKDTLSGGSVYDLTGLRYDFSRKGFRLPTEAEWEFAARGNRAELPFSAPVDTVEAAACAWYAANSCNTSHPAAGKKGNAFGLYDMEGNVFEWVNDWKGYYTGASIIDPLGAQLPDAEYERVIKGGSFRHGYLYLRPSRRSGTYPASVSSLAEYVGFRCAFGAVPAGHNFIDRDTTVIQSNSVDLVENPLRQSLAALQAKIVFVNVQKDRRTLCAVDFGAPHPMIREFADMQAIYCPSVSPDGRFVAFATRNEGLSGAAAVFVRRIDGCDGQARKIPGDSCFVPRWWVDRNTNDTFIVYVNSAEDNGSSTWTASVTYKQKMSGGVAVGERTALITGGGFHDGVSSNGRFAATGYRKSLMRDNTTGEIRQLFTYPSNGKDAQASDQACNVSICPDPRFENRCLLLDFGYPFASSLVGSSYGNHEYLFMTDFDRAIHACIRKPEGTGAWADVEWSNRYPLAIAGATSANESEPYIYIVNLTDYTAHRVLQGVELRQPALWLAEMGENPDFLSIDSLGRYDDPPITDFQAAFSFKMHLFWKNRATLEAAFIGSSQIFSGIDCSRISGFGALNLGYGGCGVSGSMTMARDYVLNHCPNIKVICLSATPYWLAEPGGNASDLDAMGVSCSKGYTYDKNHGFWKYHIPQNFDDLMARAPFHYCCEWDSFGLAPGPCDGWGGDAPDCGGRIDWNTDNANYRQNFAMIKSLAEECATRKIHVIMIVFPESPAYKNTAYFGRNGPSWKTGKAVIAELKSLETGNPYYHLYDAYNSGDHDYTDSDAGNWNHLCPAGAAKLTSRLDTLIHGIINSNPFH